LAKAVQYLHEEHGILHSELVPKNFICRKGCNEIVICDFGTAKVLGPEGVVHKGTKVYWNAKFQAPEMGGTVGVTIAADDSDDDSNTPAHETTSTVSIHEFSYPSDVWQLGTSFATILNQGITGKHVNQFYGKGIDQLVRSMVLHDPKRRPTIGKVVEIM